MKSTAFIVMGLVFFTHSYPQSITVSCSGDVGIGCTPGYKLDVDGNSRFQDYVGFGCPPSTYRLDVSGNSRFQSNVGIGCTPTSYPFDVNGNSRFQSNVGIGCFPSTYRLDVYGNSRFQSNVGIGCTPTSYKFDVYGNSRFQGNVGINCAPSSSKLKVDGDSYFSGLVSVYKSDPDETALSVDNGKTYLWPNVYIGYLTSPKPQITVSENLIIKAVLEEYPSPNIGSLGTSDDQWGAIYGYSIYANGTYLGSDLRLKENIRELDNSVEKIKLLRPVLFDFIPFPVPEIPGWRESVIDQNNKGKNRTGFIAQEVLNVIPDIVEYDTAGDKYYIDYNALIPYLVEAIQEQQQMIEFLKSEINDLKSGYGDNLKSGLITGTENNVEQSPGSVLFQNEPNPFNEDTKIKFFIPESCDKAILYIYNMEGEQITSTLLNQRSYGTEIIHGNDLQPGMYLYTLIVDGLEVGTKRMILTN